MAARAGAARHVARGHRRRAVTFVLRRDPVHACPVVRTLHQRAVVAGLVHRPRDRQPASAVPVSAVADRRAERVAVAGARGRSRLVPARAVIGRVEARVTGHHLAAAVGRTAAHRAAGIRVAPRTEPRTAAGRRR